MVLNDQRTNVGSNMEASIVPDLMRVYDSLTQNNSSSQVEHDSKIHHSAVSVSSNTTYTQSNAPSTNSEDQHEQCLTVKPSGSREKDQYQDEMKKHEAHPRPHVVQAVPNQERRMPIHELGPSVRKRSALDLDKGNSDSDTKSRRKKSGKDDRWSKRFAWPDELHRDFVSAVFDVGLKHASPSAIIEQMAKDEQITPERIKSHLQKYRLHRQKAKEEFMGSYDIALQKLKARKMENNSNSMKPGERAAHMTLSAMTETETEENLSHGSILNGGTLRLPNLTESEMRSPIGASMGYLMGLFFSLKQQLLAQRSLSESTSNVIPSVSFQPVPPPTQQISIPIQQPVYSSCNSAQVHHVSQCHGYSINSNPIHYQVPAPPIDCIQGSSQTMQIQHPLQVHLGNQYIQGEIQMTPPQHYVYVDPSKENKPDSQSAMNIKPPSSMTAIGPRVNTTLEENDIMKRDMRSQMAFQNKIRKLKETELNKSITKTNSVSAIETFGNNSHNTPAIQTVGSTPNNTSTANHPERTQNCAEENIEPSHPDFWTDVVDEELFDFLINE